MERKGLIAGAIVLVLVALGLGIWVSQSEEAARGVGSRGHADREGRDGVASARPLGGSDARGGAAARPGALEQDGGVPRGAIPPALPGGRRRDVPPMPELPASATDAERSAGWRLGQTRQRIAVVEPRIARMRELIAGFEQRGDTAAADQQRRILQRFETRLAELRTEETELQTQATQDGTLGEAEQGFQATADEHGGERPPAPANGP